MSIGLKLEQSLKLTQQLVMTPQLQLAIKLLQLNTIELQQVVQKELVENPTLEESSFEEVPNLPENDGENAERVSGNDNEETRVAKDLLKVEEPSRDAEETLREDFAQNTDLERTKDPDTDWDKYFDYMAGPSDITPRDTGGEDRPGFESMLAQESSLHDYLMWQLRFSRFSEEEVAIGEQIIGNIDDDGYLGYKDSKGRFNPITLEDIARQNDFVLQDVEVVHKRILMFDPYGSGARDLQECLLAQTRFLDPPNPLVARILREHWKLVERRRVDKIARACKVPQDQVAEAMHLISTMDPKPGHRYSDSPTQFVVPDIYVYKVGDDYHILLNEDGLPKLRISNAYQKSLKGHDKNTETKDYIKNKIRSASWLIRSIHQRQRTIYKVTEAIVQRQRGFFDVGVENLKPMILRDIAEDIGMHECTVSRVTTGKYVHTPQGIFELKYFFNSGITNSDGEGIASETIKNRIKDLVDRENPKKPLSDQKIVNILKDEGISVARRTVAKYREMLGILSSSGRKKSF